MKNNTHPNLVDAKVTCACGNAFDTRSVKGDLRLDICSNCHPFFTGTQKLLDSEGRIDRFKRKYGSKTS